MSNALAAFTALSQETRLGAFRLLVRAGKEGMFAGEISEALQVRQNTMSSHLSVLMAAGLIQNKREGRAVRYVANIAGLNGMLAYLLQDCCGGQPELCAPFIESLTKGC